MLMVMLGSSSRSGGGFVLRDPNGFVLLTSSESFDAEVLALLQGVQHCSTNGFYNVFVESDSKTLMDCLHGKMAWKWRNEESIQ